MSIKIVIPELQKKAFLVETSNRNMDAALNVQLKMAESEDTEDKTGLEITSMQRGALHTAIDFVAKTLKLDEKLQDKLWDIDFLSTFKLASRLSMRIQGMTEAEYKKATEPASEDEPTDPKEQ